ALRPALAGLVLGVTALWLPDVLGIGQEALRFATIEGAFSMGELSLLVAAKIALTALCIGFGFAGGVFSPALLIGVLFGALYWTLLSTAGIVATSGVAVYAICGMMAVTSPVIGAPLTTILIVFELTRSYDLTIAAMVAVVFSNLIAQRAFGRSLYDVQLARQGVDLSAGRDRARLDAIRVAAYGTRDFPRAGLDDSARTAIERMADSPWKEVFVTDADGLFRGTLRDRDSPNDSSVPVSAVLTPPQVVFDETTTVWGAMGRLEGFIGDAVPIVDSNTRQLMGVVPESAIIEAYLDIVQDLRREENAAA
ncbi:MAG TPA: chloride channel protein, partial [Kiloniellales bacterium]|nr:chloride channel protein [Kiloniellales bacterium]